MAFLGSIVRIQLLDSRFLKLERDVGLQDPLDQVCEHREEAAD